MSVVSVTTKGQVTIPVAVRRSLGIHPRSKASGAAMLHARSKRRRSLLNFDPAALLKNK